MSPQSAPFGVPASAGAPVRTDRSSARPSRSRTAALALLALVLSVLVGAIGAAPASAAGQASIAGKVTGGGDALEGVTVWVYEDTGGGSFEYRQSATTGADGTYRAGGLPDGDLVVEFSNVTTATGFAGEYYDDVRSSNDAERIPVGVDAAITGIDADLETQAVITGRVVDSAQDPIANVSVSASSSDGYGYATTDADGRYELRGLTQSDDYRVQFNDYTGTFVSEYHDDQRTYSRATLVPVTAGQTVPLADAVLARGGSIAGTVTAPDGTGVDDVSVSVLDADGNQVGSWTTTSADGTYRLGGLPSGTFTVRFAPDDGTPYRSTTTSITLLPEDDVTGVDGELEFAPQISGTVLKPDGTPAASINVNAAPTNFDGAYGHTTTDADGRYTLNGLDDTTYRVSFQDSTNTHATEYYDDAFEASASTPVEARTPAHTGIDAQLSAAGTITGTISDAQPSPQLSGVTVGIVNDDGTIAQSTTANTQGQYTLRGVAPGARRVVFAPRYYGSTRPYLQRYWQNASTRSRATNVTVTAGATTALGDQPLVRGASIEGTLTGRRAFESTTLWAYDTNDRMVASAYVPSGDTGDFRLDGLPAGTYRVGTATYDTRRAFHPRGTSLEGSTSVTVATGQTVTGIDVALPEDGRISGTVRDEGGNEVPDVRVRVADAARPNDGYRYSTTADANGAYELPGVPAGKYVVRFEPEPSTGLVAAFHGGSAHRDEATTVVVPAGDAGRADGVLRPGGEIAGTVLEGDEPLEGATVYAVAGDYPDDFQVTATTGADGTYRLRGLRSDAYRVSFSADGYDSRERGTLVEVRGTEVAADIDARFRTGGTVAGTVTRESGEPAENERVVVYSDERNGSWGAYTDEDGHYEVAGLNAGGHRVVVGHDDGSSEFATTYATASGGSTRAADAASYPVAVGETTTVDVTGRTAATISGRVERADGSALGYASISAIDAGGRVVRSTQSHYATGEYRLRGLKPGSYRLRFSAFGFTDRYNGGAATLEEATPFETTVAAPASGQDATLPASGSGPGAGTNEITGTVLDADGEPVQGVYVGAHTSTGFTVGSSYSSDAEGVYRIVGVPDGGYAVGFSYSSGGLLPAFHPNAETRQTATQVEVEDGERQAGVDVTVRRGASVGGRLTDPDGEPIASASVDVYGPGDTFSSAGAQTDAEGYYRVSGLRSGAVKLRFSGPSQGFATEFHADKPTLETATELDLAAGERRSGVDAQLARGGGVAGTITDQEGAGVARARVELVTSQFNVAERVVYTDALGRYTAQGLRTAEYRVRVVPPGLRPDLAVGFSGNAPTYDEATAYSVDVGVTIGDADVRLRSGQSVAGRVTGGGQPLEDVGVFASGPGDESARTTTDEDGEYTLRALARGDWRVQFSDRDGDFLDETYDPPGDATRVTVGDTPVTGIDADLDPAGVLSGSVLDESGDVVGSGSDFARPQVRIRSLDPELEGSEPYVQADATGHFVARGLRPGQYRVSFDAPGYVSEFYDDQPAAGPGTTVTVEAGEHRRGVDARLARGGTVTGVVRGPDGTTPASYVSVTAYDDQGRAVGYDYTFGDGVYSIDTLPAGPVRLQFGDDDYAYETEFYEDEASLATADPIEVEAGETVRGRDATLAARQLLQPGSVTGTVVDATGPVAGADVTLYDDEQDPWAVETTNAAGQYEFEDVPVGTYYVGAAASGHSPRFHDAKTALADADPVTVTSGTATPVGALSLPVLAPEPGTISGRLLPTGKPGTSVAVLAAGGDGTTVAATAVVAADGTWKSAGLPAGSYKVRYRATGYAEQWHAAKTGFAQADAVAVDNDDDAALGTATLVELPGRISGTIRAAPGDAPIAGATVRAYRASDGGPVPGTAVQTGADGSYTLTGLTPGQYKVGAEADEFTERFHPDAATVTAGSDVAVTADTTTPGVDVALPTPPATTGRVTGTLSGDAGPIDGGTVKLYDGTTLKGTRTTTPTGTYSFTGVDPGTVYHVGFEADGYAAEFFDDVATLPQATDLSVTAGTTTTADATLAPLPATLQGVVRSGGSGLQGVTVTAYGAGDAVRGTATTGANGSFSIEVPHGTYRVGYGKAGFVDQYWNTKGTLATATDVALARGATSASLDARLVSRTAPATIAGRVTGSGSALPNATVKAYDDAGAVAKTATTASDGRFSLSVPPGSYRLEAGASGFVTRYSGGAADLAGAARLTVGPEAELTGQDLALAAVTVDPPPPVVVVDPPPPVVVVDPPPPAVVVDPPPPGNGGGGTDGGGGGGGGTPPAPTVTTPPTTTTPTTPTPPAPPAAPLVGALKLSSSLAVKTNGSFVVRVTCPKGKSCRGALRVTVKIKKKTVTVAKGTVKAKATKVTLKLAKAGKKALKAGRGKLKVTISLTAVGAKKPSRTKKVTLKAAKGKAKAKARA